MLFITAEAVKAFEAWRVLSPLPQGQPDGCIVMVPRHDLMDLPYSDTFTWSDLFRVEDTTMPGSLRRVFREAYRYCQRGVDVSRHTLDVRTFVLDDALGEYLAFVEWLAPYSASVGYVGYVREEASPHPVLLYFQDGAVDYLDIADVPAELWLSHAPDG